MTPLAFSVAIVLFVGALLAVSMLYWGSRTRARAAQLELQRRVGTRDMHPAVLRNTLEIEAKGLVGSVRGWLSLQLRSAGAHGTEGGLALRIGLYAVGGGLLTALVLEGPAMATGLLAGVIPVLLLRSQARKRREALVAQLPEALDLISRSLRAGHALSDAFRSAALEMQAPLGEELMTLSEQHRLGMSLRESLDHLVDRNPEVFDLRLLASSVMLQRETGANLIEILEHLAETIRERQVFTHKLAALTAEVRVSAAILTVLPFFVAGVILLMRPAYLAPLVVRPLGQIIFAGGLVSLFIGLMLMRTLARVEV